MTQRTGSVVMSIFMIAGFLLAVQQAATTENAVNAKTVAEHMDKSKYSSAEIKSYLKGLKGNAVTADGKVHEILTGKTGNRVVVYVSAGKSKDFVVDVYVVDAGKLHKGENVSCKGIYHKYNTFTVNGITLKDGSCSKQ